MRRAIANVRREDTGATAIEYALMASLIALAIVGGVAAVGDQVVPLFQQVVDGFPD
jgi:pilus assembly protein Flp/PilA